MRNHALRYLMSGNPLVAYYPLTYNLLSLGGGLPMALSRATSKLFINDDGNFITAPSNSAAFTGLGVMLEPSCTDRGRGGSTMDVSPWTSSYCVIASATDPTGGSGARKFTTNSGSNADTYANVMTSGGSGTTWISFFAKSNTDWIVFGAGQTTALSNGQRVWLNLTTKTVGTVLTYGTGFALSDFEFYDMPNGFVQVKCKSTSSYIQMGLQFLNADDDGVLTMTTGDYYTLWELDCKDAYLESIIPTPAGSNVSVSPDILSLPMTNLLPSEFAILLHWKPLSFYASGDYVYYDGDDVIGSATEELSVKYLSGTWRLKSKTIAGGTKTVTATLSAVAQTDYAVYFKVSGNGLYLCVDDGVTTVDNTGVAETTPYRGANAAIASTDGVSVVSNIKLINSPYLSLAQAEAL